MTIKFEKETRRLKTMIRPSGRLQARHLEEMKRQMEGTRTRIVLDLNGVTLVDVETIRFLNV
jgi:anti-anti-sigma regulatory factor